MLTSLFEHETTQRSEYNRPMTPLMIAARAIARRMHAGHVDKGDKPIFEHLDKVAWAVYAFSDWNPDAYIVGILHDLLEDTTYPVANLADEFGAGIVEALLYLKHDDKDSYRTYIDQIAESGNLLAIEVKLCDLMHNTCPRRAVTHEQKLLRVSRLPVYEDAIIRLSTARMHLNVC